MIGIKSCMHYVSVERECKWHICSYDGSFPSTVFSWEKCQISFMIGIPFPCTTEVVLGVHLNQLFSMYCLPGNFVPLFYDCGFLTIYFQSSFIYLNAAKVILTGYFFPSIVSFWKEFQIVFMVGIYIRSSNWFPQSIPGDLDAMFNVNLP